MTAVLHTRTEERPWPLWRLWALATTAGELLGFAVPALTGMATLWLIGAPDTVGPALAYLVLLPAAGAGEGAILAAAQWRILRRPLPAVSQREWVGATAAGAATAWVLGMLPSTLDAIVALPVPATIALWAAIGVPLLCTIGVAQALVLRHYLDHSSRWITANVLGWLLGLPATFIIPSLVPNGSPTAVWVSAFLLSGVLMGAIVGVTTGVALQRLVEHPRRS